MTLQTYLVTGTLRRPGQNYSDFHAAIKRASDGWWHQMNDIWLVNTVHSAAQLRDYLCQFLDINDQLFVVKINMESAWYNLPEDAGKWLQQHLPIFAKT